MNKPGIKVNPYLLLLLLIIVGYWQVSFLQSAFKWDLIDVVFPFRYYFSECIQSGYFPFWNPYLQTGTPFFADLQAPTFYPELLLTSIISGYGIYTMHFWFVIYLFIAAVGMYELSFYFKKNKTASLLAGTAYAFSGFIIGHGQHFFLLVGAAWIPLVLVNYIKLLEKGKTIQVLKTAVFVFLMISGAYQALSFTLFYLLLLIFVYFIVKEIRRKQFKAVFHLLKVNVYLLVLVLLFSLPLIVSTLEIISSVDRLEQGISLEQTISSGLTLKSIISFVLPFATLKYDAFWGADLSMRNHYIGLIPLLFFGLALLKRRSTLEYLMLGFGLIIFASSISALPVREFMFRYIPFMNLFKYAAYLKVFALLACILILANYFTYFQENFDKEVKKLKYLLAFFSIGIIALLIYSFGKLNEGEFETLSFNGDFETWKNNLPFYGHVIVQGAFQLLVVSLFFVLLLLRKRITHFTTFVFLLFIVDIFTATQLNMSTTVVDPVVQPYQMNKDLKLAPENFPLPVNSKIKYNDNQHAFFKPFWRNTPNFTKEISFLAFSSFELNSFNKLDDDFPNLKQAVLDNHLVYFSDQIFSITDFSDDKIGIETDSKNLYFSNKDYSFLKGLEAKTDSSDKVEIIEFSPNSIRVKTNTKNSQFLTMLQTNFEGWKSYINEEEVPIYTSNFNYRSIYLPPGDNTVHFKYKNNKIVVLYIVSSALFFLVLLLLLARSVKRNSRISRFYLVIPGMVLLTLMAFTIKRLTYIDKHPKTNELLAEKWLTKEPLYHFMKEPEEQNGFKITANDEFFTLTNIDNHEHQLKKGTLVVRAKVKTNSYVEALVVSDVQGKEESVWHAGRIEKQIEKLNGWNPIIYQRNLYDLEPNQTIRVYIWNNKKGNFKIDDITVEFYPFK